MKPLLLSLIVLGILSPPAYAHHTWSVEYAADVDTEIEGVISSIAWVNPHVRFKVLVGEGTDEEQIWDIAGTSVSFLARMDVNKSILSVGDRVRMAGHMSKRSDHALYLTNLLLPDGREAVFSLGEPQRWPGERIGDAKTVRGVGIQEELAGTSAQRPDNIFAVWTTLLSDSASRGLFPRNTDDFPLTDLARKKISEYNPDTDSPFGSCSPKGASAAMNAPYPVELIDQGDSILLKLEEYDSVREIHLSKVHDDKNVAPSTMGYSTGYWEGDSLVVTTTKSNYPFLDIAATPDYIPQSNQARMQETFKLGPNNERLYYTLTLTDPAMLTEPMVLGKYYQWRPGATINPYICDETESLH